MPPIWIPIDEKFAKPQSANVAMSLPFSESCPTTSFIIEKAKNSLMTVLLAIRFPTIAVSCLRRAEDERERAEDPAEDRLELEVRVARRGRRPSRESRSTWR